MHSVFKKSCKNLEGSNALSMWYYLYPRCESDLVTHMSYATCVCVCVCVCVYVVYEDTHLYNDMGVT